MEEQVNILLRNFLSIDSDKNSLSSFEKKYPSPTTVTGIVPRGDKKEEKAQSL
jgi:hypothetical protein